MAASRRTSADKAASRRPPAKSPRDRENELIELAVDLTEQKMRDGTAPAQLISHYLKLGSTREELEQKRLEQENKLMAAKVEQIASQAKLEELFTRAIASMKNYGAETFSEHVEEYEGEG